MPYKEYIAPDKYNNPCAILNLAHHVSPPLSWDFNRLFVKYRDSVVNAIINNTIP